MRRCRIVIEFDVGLGEGAADPLVWINYISAAVLRLTEYFPKIRILNVKIIEDQKDAA